MPIPSLGDRAPVRMSAAGDADGGSGVGFGGSGSGCGPGSGSGACDTGAEGGGAGRVGSFGGTGSAGGGTGLPGPGRASFDCSGEGAAAELGLGDAFSPWSSGPVPAAGDAFPVRSRRPPDTPTPAPAPALVPPSGSAATPCRSTGLTGVGLPASSPTLMQPPEAATASDVTIQTARRPGTDNWRTGGTSGTGKG
ncbi:hypothetical protein [Streptomyces sp. NPDC051569]|uniref:hypothetical protein n=1 Tax=Streptomyces sp. NPDC051569 TaxID=3365661 RepID=UPI0037A622F0